MKKYSQYNSTEYTDVPMLQRDYVQGADVNADKRDPFLKSIFNSLLKGTPLKVDFVYGSSRDGNPRKAFLPIDGQQRLTTLALVGWLLVQKQVALHPENAPTHQLPQMCYRTRHTTEQFFDRLMGYKLPANYGDIREHIKTRPLWMSRRWVDDPSIGAMLDLLAAADRILALPEYAGQIDNMANSFFTNSTVEFEQLDMKAYNLTEDLYVKMNARGKHLSAFENWKAEFTKMLIDNYSADKSTFRTVAGVPYTKAQYFSYAIEHDWTDLLWPAAYQAWHILSDSQKKKSLYPRIDEQFMNLLDFISMAIANTATKSDTDASVDYDLVNLYANPANLTALFNALDALCKLYKNSVDPFSQLLYSAGWNPGEKRIRLFATDDADNGGIDLFDRCIKAQLNMPARFLLWGIIQYCIKHDCSQIASMLDYTRVIYGWILNIDQRRGKKILSVRANIRTNDFWMFGIVVDLLLHSSDVYQSLDWIAAQKGTQNFNKDAEKDKGLNGEIERHNYRKKPGYAAVLDSLMGCEYLKGNFSNVYPAIDRGTAAPDLQARFETFYRAADHDKARALIRHAWRGIADIEGCGHYPFYGAQGHWDYIFSAKAANTCQAIEALLSGEPEQALSMQRREYYVDKYADFYSTKRWSETPSHLFYADSDFVMTSMGANYTYSMLWYRHCPYAYTVNAEMKKHHGSVRTALMLNVDFEAGHRSRLRLNRYKNDEGNSDPGLYWLKCVPEGWECDFSADPARRWIANWEQRFAGLSSGSVVDTQGEFSFGRVMDSEGRPTVRFILKDLAETDRIQTCIKFLCVLHSLMP